MKKIDKLNNALKSAAKGMGSLAKSARSLGKAFSNLSKNFPDRIDFVSVSEKEAFYIMKFCDDFHGNRKEFHKKINKSYVFNRNILSLVSKLKSLNYHEEKTISRVFGFNN